MAEPRLQPWGHNFDHNHGDRTSTTGGTRPRLWGPKLDEGSLTSAMVGGSWRRGVELNERRRGELHCGLEEANLNSGQTSTAGGVRWWRRSRGEGRAHRWRAKLWGEVRRRRTNLGQGRSLAVAAGGPRPGWSTNQFPPIRMVTARYYG